MNKAAFLAYCDLQVGDYVHCSALPPAVYIIYDILTVHSYRTGAVEFIFHLSDTEGNVIGVDIYRKTLEPC